MNEQELARAVADSMATADQKIFDLLGISVLEAVPGAAVTAMAVREDMVNSHAYCHGGLVYTLADTAFAYAVSSHNRASVTLCGQIQYIKPARLGDQLTASARVSSLGGRTGTCDVVVRNQTDRVIARFSGTAFRLDSEVVENAKSD